MQPKASRNIEEIAERFRSEPITSVQLMMEDGTPVLYIIYSTGVEKRVTCKTKEGAISLQECLLRKPIPCKLCGTLPSVQGDMHSCTRCSIHVGTRQKWTELMMDATPLRTFKQVMLAPLRVCKLVVLESDDSFLQVAAARAIQDSGKLDMSEHFVKKEDADAATEAIKVLARSGT